MVVVVCFFCEFASTFGQNVYITGGCPELGNWDASRARRMRYWWPWYVEVALELPAAPVEYKYFILHDHVPQPPLWEHGQNRTLDLGSRDNAGWFVRDVFTLSPAATPTERRREIKGPETLEHLTLDRAALAKATDRDFARLAPALRSLTFERDVSTVPGSLGLLSSLESLLMPFARVERLPESLTALSALRTLNANACRLRELPESLGQLRALRTLELSGNALSELPDSIGSLESLTELNVANNQLRTLPASLGRCTVLKVLRLGYNELQTLPPELSRLAGLERIELQHNDIGWVPPEMSALSKLQVLDVSDNNNLVALPAGLFFRLGSDNVSCNYIAHVDPRLQFRVPTLLSDCLTVLANLGNDRRQRSLLPSDLCVLLDVPAKLCDGCGCKIMGTPWVAELFHWTAHSPIGNALGVPLVACYCSPRCLPVGRRRFAGYQPGSRYDPHQVGR